LKVNENVLHYPQKKGAQMLWDHLITILFMVSLTMVLKHLDTMPGYSCPKYCGVQHEHWDHRSDFDQQIDENAKLSKNRELASK